jgi:hypothetical protein
MKRRWSVHARAVLSLGLAVAGAVEAASLAETTLRGTIVVSDPNRSLALFEFGPGNLRTLRVGADVPGIGTLTQIGPRGVRFRASGSDVDFTFNDSALGTGGNVLPGTASGTADSGVATSGTAAPRVDNPRGFVMPDDGYRRSSNPAEAALDATPRPGQTLDTTVWDRPYVPPPPRNVRHAASN